MGILNRNIRFAIQDQVRIEIIPKFTSIKFGDPGYMQLAGTCPLQIKTGAENGSEMGVFCFLKQPQREKNLQIALSEYLPIGLQAGVIYVT